MAKRISTPKDEAAKNKINSLLKDVLPKKTEEKNVDVLDKVVENKGNEWLQDQVDALTLENEQLRNDLQKSMIDINKLRNAPTAPVDTIQIQNNVRLLFNDLESAFLGRNPQKIRYYDAKIKILLDKMLGLFPFLSNR